MVFRRQNYALFYYVLKALPSVDCCLQSRPCHAVCSLSLIHWIKFMMWNTQFFSYCPTAYANNRPEHKDPITMAPSHSGRYCDEPTMRKMMKKKKNKKGGELGEKLQHENSESTLNVCFVPLSVHPLWKRLTNSLIVLNVRMEINEFSFDSKGLERSPSCLLKIFQQPNRPSQPTELCQRSKNY